MTDKDPKDMTASELLRWAANYANITCRACQEMGFGCDDANDCDCDNAWGFIANKIDAELAQARRICLDHVASLWAKDNGWPDFREGEDFGAWLDRCALMRPRYDNGDPVDMEDFGDPESDDFARYTVSDSGDWTIYAPAISPDPIEGDISERVERPDPEVIGADGLPIKVGDAMWSLSGAGPLTVTSLHTDDPTPDGGDSPWADLDDDGLYSWIYAGSLTHTQPDTLERLRDDMYRTAEEWREADSVSVTDMNHWANRLAALIERKGGE